MNTQTFPSLSEIRLPVEAITSGGVWTDAQVRVLSALTAIAIEHSALRGDNAHRTDPIPLEAVAEAAGVGIPSVRRSTKALAERGLIQIGYSMGRPNLYRVLIGPNW